MIQIQFIISIHIPIFYYIRDRAKYKRCSLPNEIEYVFKIVLFISFGKEAVTKAKTSQYQFQEIISASGKRRVPLIKAATT